MSACALSARAQTAERVALYPTPGFNLQVLERSGATVTLAPQTKGAAHNWFAGLFTGLPVGREVTLAIEMKGQDTANRADVGKWKGLRPVISYADPNAWETYVSYTRGSDGVWQSDDPFARGTAGRGETPQQKAIAPALAPLFLGQETRPNPDSKAKAKTIKVETWSAWRELETVEADTKANRFLIRHAFALPYATVAMRVPFTAQFHELWARKLVQSGAPHLLIEKIGTTPGGRDLLVFDVRDGDARPVQNDAKPTILLTAREHATEHAGSWALYGLVMALLNDTPQAREMRQSANWLLIPLQDPDGADTSTFARMTESFAPGSLHSQSGAPPEIWAYMKFLRAHADAGHTIDLAISIHNVESDEAPNLSTPFTDNFYIEATDAINSGLFPFIKKAGFEVGGAQQGHIGASPWRLYGWSAIHFGSLPLAYEVNDRWPKNRLSHDGLGRLGAWLGLGLARWCQSERGQKWHRGARSFLAKRGQAREAAYAKRSAPGENSSRARYDLLTKGY